MCPEQLFPYWTHGPLPNSNLAYPWVGLFSGVFYSKWLLKLYTILSVKSPSFVREQWPPGSEGDGPLSGLGRCFGVLQLSWKRSACHTSRKTMCVFFNLKKCWLLGSNLIWAFLPCVPGCFFLRSFAHWNDFLGLSSGAFFLYPCLHLLLYVFCS